MRFEPDARMRRAPALEWFLLAAAGALGGVGPGRAVPTAVLLAGCAFAAGLGLFEQRRAGWLRPSAAARLLLGAALALAMAASSAERYREFARLERGIERGARVVLSGRVTEVTPYPGGRIAVGVAAPGGGPAGGWQVRLIADGPELVAALAAYPPVAGELRLPVRAYPFSPAGNPGEFDRRLWALAQGYLANAYLDVPSGPAGTGEDARFPPACDVWPLLKESIGDGLTWTQRLAWRWRCLLAPGGGTLAEAVSLGLTLGQTDLIPAEWRERFSRAGVAHLLSVSGLHVGFVLMVVAAPLSRGLFRRLPLAAALVPALAAVAFVDLTGRPASALRAGIMAVAVALARSLGRRASSGQMLGVAGLALLIHNPHLALDLGFQLSFLATGGIVAVAAPLTRWARAVKTGRGRVARVLAGAALGIGMSVAAQWVTTPLTAAAFSYVSWIAPLVNVVAIPLGTAALLANLTGLAVGEIWAQGGALLRAAGKGCAALLVSLVAVASEWGGREVAMPSATMSLGIYGAGAGAALLIRAWARPQAAAAVLSGRRLLAAGLSLVVAAGTVPALKSAAGVVEVWTLDVGQGDALLIRAPWGRAALVDGGGVSGGAASGYDIGEARVVPTLRRLGVRRLDLVVSTHPDADHVQGLAAVVRERDVRRVVASHATSASLSYRRFVDAVAAQGLPLEHLEAGDVFVLGSGAVLRVLASGSPTEWAGGRLPGANDRSIGLLLEAHGRRVLLLGDMQDRGVQRLLAAVADLRAEGLIVPHHGARLGSLEALLQAVQPEVAFVSVGRANPYGHPAGETLRALAARGIRTLRTDRRGALYLAIWPWGLRVGSVRGPDGADGGDGADP